MGEAEEARIISIKVSSSLTVKLEEERQLYIDMILSRLRDLSWSRHRGLMSKEFDSEVLSACSCPF